MNEWGRPLCSGSSLCSHQTGDFWGATSVFTLYASVLPIFLIPSTTFIIHLILMIFFDWMLLEHSLRGLTSWEHASTSKPNDLLILPGGYRTLQNRACLLVFMITDNSAGNSAGEKIRAEETMGVIIRPMTRTCLLGAVVPSGWSLPRDVMCHQHPQPLSLCCPLPWPPFGPWDLISLWTPPWHLATDTFTMDGGGFSSLLLHSLPQVCCFPELPILFATWMVIDIRPRLTDQS